MGNTFPARQAEPGQRFSTRDDEQGEIELVAGEDGIVQPQTLAEHRAAEAFRIPLAEGHEAYAGPLYTHPAIEAAEGELVGMTREQLRERAKELGLPVSGTKTELEERIAAAEAAQGNGGEA